MVSDKIMQQLIDKLPKDPMTELAFTLNRQIDKLQAENAKLKEDLVELDNESRKFRGTVARGNGDCSYCGLSKEDMSKCDHGFPGCGRADDMINDPNWDPTDIS